MSYIVFDMEFNQDILSLTENDNISVKYPFEIIQIGAIKLNSNLDEVASFNRYIKPHIYKKVSPFITELTGITTEQLFLEKSFPEVFKEFVEFINDSNAIMCVWGMSDIKELYKNAGYHKLNIDLLPKMFINLQPYVSLHFHYSKKKLLRLQNAVELLNISSSHKYHNALYDAYYTAEVFKKVYNISIQPKIYNPSYVRIRVRNRKRIIDTEKLIQQFEKMYDRTISEEEKDMIILAYKMGKTNQFIKFLE